MNKKLLVLALFGLAFSGNAQVFSEDFESGEIPANWTQTTISGTPQWGVNSELWQALFTTNYALTFDDDANGDGSVDAATIETTTINLAGYSTASLSFDSFNVQYENPSTVTVEVFDGANWQEVFFNDSDEYDVDANENLVPISHTIDVTNFINANFKIRFKYDDAADWSYGCGFDNIVVTGTLSVNDFNLLAKVQVYPNPTVTSFQLTSPQGLVLEDAKVIVLDLTGKPVKNYSAVQNAVYDVSDLSSGNYVVQLKAANTTQVFKLIKI